MKAKFLLHCDWFSVSVRIGAGIMPATQDIIEGGGYSFEICDPLERSPLFQSAFLVRIGDRDIAHLFCRGKYNKDAAVIKVANSRLYSPLWHLELKALVSALGWSFHHIQRVDIAADFNEFHLGRNPWLFAQAYLNQPTRSRPSYIRHSSNKFRAYGFKTTKSVQWQTISWGNRNSPVQVNLYNKSAELKETGKEWIAESWREGELLNDETHSVWRVEFSINPSRVAWRSVNGDKWVREIDILDAATHEGLLRSFEYLVPAYFKFYVLNYDDLGRRVRDLQEVQLFDLADAVATAAPLRSWRKSNRTDLLALRKIEEYRGALQLSSEERSAFDKVIGRVSELLSIPQDNLATDSLTEWLTTCFHIADPVTKVDYRRQARRIVQMLRGSHDEDCERYIAAVRSYSEMLQDDIFLEMLRHADEVASSWLPDEVISQWVDDEVEEEAVASLSYPPYTPPEAEDCTRETDTYIQHFDPS